MWATLRVNICWCKYVSLVTLYAMLSLNHADNYHNNDYTEIWRPEYLCYGGNTRCLAVKP